MTPYDNGRGYLVLNLKIDDKYRCKGVNDLVLSAFSGPRPSKIHEAAHLDGDRSNNRLSNLKWCTAKENASHRRIHGSGRLRESRLVHGVECFRCSQCKEWKPRTDFHALRKSQTVCGIVSACKRCSNDERMARKAWTPPAEVRWWIYTRLVANTWKWTPSSCRAAAKAHIAGQLPIFLGTEEEVGRIEPPVTTIGITPLLRLKVR